MLFGFQKKKVGNVGKVVLGSNYEGASSRQINIEFNGKKIVEDIVVNLSPGKIVAISGPSGSGKTSILRELCGLGEWKIRAWNMVKAQ